MWSKIFDENFSLVEEMIQDGASEFYDLGIISDGKIENMRFFIYFART